MNEKVLDFMETKFYEQAQVAFKKLSPKEGDTIAVSFPKDMAMEQIYSVVTYLQQLAEEFSCAIIILGQGVELNVISEEEMAKHGWVRADPDRTIQ